MSKEIGMPFFDSGIGVVPMELGMNLVKRSNFYGTRLESLELNYIDLYMIIMTFFSKWAFKDLAVRFDISEETTQRDGWCFSNCSKELIYEG